LRALEPAREPNTDELPRVIPIHAGSNLGRDRRQSEPIDPELLLEARLVNALGAAKARRRSPAIPFFKPSSYD
jgi:hypothetical protein